ncbi:LRR_6 domain-containing protein [Cephalotus follicularis]|uniref:LRR_6 domain-containing protein n=1 Tax=Cephalotus follicularis TaxID=3775 RepID=A0A1Q3BCZ8_CEPFO|nr:LRR_6 domain-containing protein [Cephalotus follicularis]
MENECELVRMCIEAACESRESVDTWRRQRRSLERLPSHLADALLRRLHRRRLLFPALLEVFKYSVEVIDLRNENSVNEEWMAYIGAFRYLRSLNVSTCRRINNSALWALTGMTSLMELDLSRCTKVTDAGVKHLLSISTLQRLHISETGLTANGVALLSSLTNLSVLDLGGLPVTDQALSSLQVLTKLQYLDLWGTKISNKGATILQGFPKLSFLNLAWTNVTNVPYMSSLECLNLSNCSINDLLLEGDVGYKAPLAKLQFSGSTFVKEEETFLNIETSFLIYLDVSNSSLNRFCFLAHMESLEHLDLSSCMMGDDSVELVACIGAKLRDLNLSKTRVSSAGVGILAGHVPNLENLSLSLTAIDDVAISYISMMPSLRVIDLSKNNIKGLIQQVDTATNSLTALQSLRYLERLNLEQTQVRDAALRPLSNFQNLRHISLRSASLTDISLYQMSSLSILTNISIRDAVLTNLALDLFRPPATLKVLDLRGCWLLTEDVISLFCKRHPHIEVRHEFAHVFPVQNSCNGPSPSGISSRTSPLNKKPWKMPVSQSFVDQRLKYSKEDLLVLRYSPLSLAYPHDAEIVRTELQ